MNYLMIENDGVLDVSSLILIGASTKRGDDSKIGFFGSGNKYAIATLIRAEVPFKIFAGEKEIIISTEDVNFRGVEFKKILIDGQATSLTTDMGPQWEEWMAIREWVSNSIDEGGSKISKEESEMVGVEGKTRFYVGHTPKIKTIVDNWDSLFTFDRKGVAYEAADGKIFEHINKKKELVLFRKGIKVYEDESKRSLYQYDLDEFYINESRIVNSPTMAAAKVAGFLGKVDDINIIRNILRNCNSNSSYWEAHLDWKWNVYKLSSAWIEEVKSKAIIVDSVVDFFADIQKSKPHYVVNISMASMLLKNIEGLTVYGLNETGEVTAYKSIETTPKIDYLLQESVNFLNTTKYEIKYPIEVVTFEKKNVLGMAHDGKILLSESVFNLGKKEIISAIIEENEHLNTGFSDCTRAFQTHFINMFLSEKEERFNVYL
jgi:hypothetical protein